MKVHQFLGVYLGGGKTDKTCLAVVDYFPEHQKIFLSHMEAKIQSSGEVSSDQALITLIKSYDKKAELLALNASIKLPKCMRCRLKCPGFENCKEPEIVWLWV